MTRRAVTLLFQSTACGALLVMAHPNRSAVMRALLPLVLLLVTGCAADFRGGQTDSKVTPRQLMTNAIVRKVLGRDAQKISFVLAQAFSSNLGENNKVRVILTNSGERTIIVRIPGAFADVPPHTSLDLLSGTLPDVLSSQPFSIWSWSTNRGAYALDIQFPASRVPPVRVVCSYAPLPPGPFLRRGDYSERLLSAVCEVLRAHRCDIPATVVRAADSSIWFVVDRFETELRFDRLHIQATAEEEVRTVIRRYGRGPSDWGLAGRLYGDPGPEAKEIAMEITKKLSAPGEARWWHVDGQPVTSDQPGGLW